MVCTSLGSLLRPLFYFLCYIHFSLSVLEEMKCVRATEAAISQTHLARARERLGRKKRIDITRIVKEVSEAGEPKLLTAPSVSQSLHWLAL